MQKEVRISPAAHNDIKCIYDYILKDGEQIARDQASLIYNGIEKLALFPDMGTALQNYVERETSLRYLIIRKIYIIVYDNTKTVDVLRVFRKDQDFIAQLGLIDD